jgi:hypothetical protein
MSFGPGSSHPRQTSSKPTPYAKTNRRARLRTYQATQKPAVIPATRHRQVKGECEMICIARSLSKTNPGSIGRVGKTAWRPRKRRHKDRRDRSGSSPPENEQFCDHHLLLKLNFGKETAIHSQAMPGDEARILRCKKSHRSSNIRR